MHPPPPAAAMDFSQNSLFGFMDDLQELTIIERPVRRSLKVRPGEEELPTPVPSPPRSGLGPSRSPPPVPSHRVTLTRPLPGLLRRSHDFPSLDPHS